VALTEWVSNPVLIDKKGGSICVCIDRATSKKSLFFAELIFYFPHSATTRQLLGGKFQMDCHTPGVRFSAPRHSELIFYFPH
jgi:hypothetical protein